ncbi:Anaphase-promoting complex subunit 4 like protein [Verticillium longisporum]|uniref:Anaphase-promoting complex subunit 4 n=1 Tax=Verticillium longisporum TaxID=100787 RepID=A0A8I2Z963_VERLO|nr:Anaphase-promoting complex subunit 4 like protein [Verticillium longisporum]
MAEPQPLRLISETKFDHRVPDGLPKSNPAVDLSVTWDAAARNLLIYRPRDQVVSKIHQYSRPGTTAPEPLALKWKPDGQFLAVGWSDGHVRLMGLENNKAAHHIRVTEDQSAGITHIGWACNSVSKTDSVLKEADTASWRHALAEELQTAGNPPELDLPRELTFLDVESSLPKLSPLPSASAGEGEDAMVFTLRTGIDFLFRPFNTAESDEVFVMVVGTSDGRLHLSIYDSFVIGDFRYTLPSSMYKPGVLQLIHHAAHPSASTHCLILKHPADDDRAVYLVPMDLPFVPYSPINLALLASKLTTLQKLLRYVKQSQLHATVEYNNTRELPSKFLRSIQEDLQGAERGPTDIVQALFHTVVTGHTHEVVKEWLVDQLAERGHKRWDKAAISGLEALRALVHENLLPALERCAVILSRLRGLAQFHDARDDIGFSAAQVARAMDVVACLRLAAHRVLLHVMEELDLFTAFSGWLRFQIDRLASSSSATEELNEKEAGLENGKVLAYIQRYLLRSPMALFFEPVAEDEREADWKFVQNEPALLDAVDAQIARQEDGQPYMKALPQLAFLVAYLEDRADGIFKDIAEAQKRSVRFGQPTRIVMGSKMSRIDCVMGPIVNGNDLEDHASTFVAAIQEGKEDELYIFRTTVRIINGISTTTSKTCAALRLGDHKITDIKFLGHETLVLLLRTTDKKLLIMQLPIQTPETKYAPYTEESLPEPEPLSAAHGFTSFTLPEGSGGGGGSPPWVPVRMEVQPRSDVRDDMPPRVCLLGRDRTTWRVFALEKDAAVPQQQEQEQENEQQQQQEQQVSTPGRDNA